MSKINRIYSGIIILSLCLLPWIGCANTTGYYPDSPLVEHWGDSVESMRLSQTVTPIATDEAAPPVEPITGLDHSAGEAVIEKYRESFETQTERQQVQMVGVDVGG